MLWLRPVEEKTQVAQQYVQIVREVDKAPGSREHVGATRICQSEMQGKRGEVVERCVELIPNQRISHVMERDAFGFSRLFEDFGFTFVLEPKGDGRTLVRLEGFYQEKSLRSRLLNTLVIKRKLHGTRAKILTDLKSLVEQSNPAFELRPARLAGNP